MYEIVKLDKKKLKESSITNVVTLDENVGISQKKFSEIVDNILMKNKSRPYPEINDIPK